ncbi:LADA_0G08966g1_1 [Lachancea dasiensis]|uniref:LADA_0G08966g1_1 n=1 Tax=Lachancea dasiensis TaxID=1072105 RepID=A0A1G4JU78_9SACH|nr:LADA_0G08966g1_1 [Lachancea dasiensis]
MSHTYNYQLSFWDEQDAGATLLLEHVSHGLESCSNIVAFFEERSKLEKDYARRLSAISGKLQSGLQQTPDYGKLAHCLRSLQATQERNCQAHSKAAVAIHKDEYAELKQRVQELQARYKTIDIKIRNICNAKITKRQLCDTLKEKLNNATTELRDCQLNKDNFLGKRNLDQNDRHLLKWKSIVNELQLKLDVLKQEYKASTKHWLNEWSQLSLELQELEKSRIQLIQLKIQDFAKHCSDMAIQEQACMEGLTQQLVKYTADQDITSFAYNHGTGRLRASVPLPHPSQAQSQLQSSSSKHAQNIRRLSSQLQRTRISSQITEELQRSPSGSLPASSWQDKPQVPDYSGRNLFPTTQSMHNDVRLLEPPVTTSAAYTTSESSNESSNPTDFTSHMKRHPSAESLSTSISSLAHSIEDSRRFAKSWNSQNRRKSKARSQVFETTTETNADVPSRSASMDTTRIHVNEEMPSTKSFHKNRRSMVGSESGSNPFKQALDEMRKVSDEHDDPMITKNRRKPTEKPLIPFPHSRHATLGDDETPSKKRVMDVDHYVELPLQSSKGETVIQYARALYTFMEANEQCIVNFRVGDYLLLTEKLDNDWFIGEVLDASKSVNPDYRYGIIPQNYIELLP